MTDSHFTEELLARALDQLSSAIALLDRAAAPPQIAAHVDLGACQLADLIEIRRGASPQRVEAESLSLQ